ncbi:hypothetical protein NC652_005142 [Populus alba x Populus x berolinensis]|nr:hypothetical protein NC652_005142 [Populus alba x Populus x berolinensis]
MREAGRQWLMVTVGVGMHANETLPGLGQQDRDKPPASETQSADGPAEKPGFSAQTPISTFNLKSQASLVAVLFFLGPP